MHLVRNHMNCAMHPSNHKKDKVARTINPQGKRFNGIGKLKNVKSDDWEEEMIW